MAKINYRKPTRVWVTLPHSEICIYMQVAGKRHQVEITEEGAQILNHDGSPLSFPITYGEAGLHNATKVNLRKPVNMRKVLVARG